MNDLYELNELLRAAKHDNCSSCGELSNNSKFMFCSICHTEVCELCLIWYPIDTLPTQFKPYLNSINPIDKKVGICKLCRVATEARFVKDIPLKDIPKYINFPFIHESNKALLLHRASL